MTLPGQADTGELAAGTGVQQEDSEARPRHPQPRDPCPVGRR